MKISFLFGLISDSNDIVTVPYFMKARKELFWQNLYWFGPRYLILFVINITSESDGQSHNSKPKVGRKVDLDSIF